jgi:diguanylate cyclase (GGDEF)-like protein
MHQDGIRLDGRKIRELRICRGWTQKDLAGKAGYAQRTIENAEAGRRILPRTLYEISQALGVSIQHLLLPRAVDASLGDESSASGPGAADSSQATPAHWYDAKRTDPAIDLESGAADQAEGEPSASILGSSSAPPKQSSSSRNAGLTELQPSKRSLLIVDDKGYVSKGIIATLGKEYITYTATSADEAEQLFKHHAIDLILSDQRMPGRSGVELLEWVRGNSPRTIRLLMTGFAEYDDLVEAINRGQIYYVFSKPWQIDELRMTLRNASEKFELERRYDQLFLEMCDLNQALEERVALRTNELKIANAELLVRTREMERLALSDPLTGLPNRRYADGLARAEAKRHSVSGNSLALGVFDVDRFKQINTDHTYAGGDMTLVGLGQILSSLLRETDAVGRLGGDEFLLIARQTDREGALALGQRVCAIVEKTPIECLGRKIGITVSGGFAVTAGGLAATYEELYKIACDALLVAKKMGGNGCVVHMHEKPPA